ncbi:MAG: hypothetical protein AAF433_05985 [Bacteroidota bacterium]
MMYTKLLLAQLLFIVSLSINLLQAQSSPPEQERASDLWLDVAKGRLGFQLNDRFMIGGRVDPLGPTSVNELSPAIGGFARYYLNNRQRRLRPYLQAEIAGYPFTIYEWQFSTTAGLEYRLNEGSALHTEFSYQNFFGQLNSDSNFDRWQLRSFLATRDFRRSNARRDFRQGDVWVRPGIFELNFYQRPNSNASRNLNFRFNPEVHYALGPRWMIGGALNIETDATRLFLDDEFKSFDLDAQLDIRYFLTESSRLKPYLATGLNYNLRTVSFDQSSSFSQSELNVQLKAGLMVPVNNNTYLDLQLGVQRDLFTGQLEVMGNLGMQIRF